MKKILGLMILGTVVLVSCKKDYTCTCTYTTTGGGSSVTNTDTYQVQEASKSQAEAACTEAKITTVNNGVTYEQVCELSK